MSKVVATLKTPSGDVFHYTQHMEGTDHVEFLWTEGNFGCDCNRSIFAVEAGAMEDELDCNSGEPSIELLSLTVDDEEGLIMEEFKTRREVLEEGLSALESYIDITSPEYYHMLDDIYQAMCKKDFEMSCEELEKA